MVYTDKNRRFLVIGMVLIITVGLLYALAGDRIKDILSSNFQTQLLALDQTDQDYLLNLPNATGALVQANVVSNEALEQAFLETLIIHKDEFDTSSETAAKDFLYQYYGFPEPVPTSVQNVIAEGITKFVQTSPFLNNTNNTTPPEYEDFINKLLTIMANHQTVTNNHQTVRRAQTTRSLLDAFVNEL